MQSTLGRDLSIAPALTQSSLAFYAGVRFYPRFDDRIKYEKIDGCERAKSSKLNPISPKIVRSRFNSIYLFSIKSERYAR